MGVLNRHAKYRKVIKLFTISYVAVSCQVSQPMTTLSWGIRFGVFWFGQYWHFSIQMTPVPNDAMLRNIGKYITYLTYWRCYKRSPFCRPYFKTGDKPLSEQMVFSVHWSEYAPLGMDELNETQIINTTKHSKPTVGLFCIIYYMYVVYQKQWHWFLTIDSIIASLHE